MSRVATQIVTRKAQDGAAALIAASVRPQIGLTANLREGRFMPETTQGTVAKPLNLEGYDPSRGGEAPKEAYHG